MKMSSSSNKVIITLLYEYGDARTYTFENVASENLRYVKDRILAINANANNEYENFYKTFVSPYGEAVTKIESCKIVQTEEEVIYSG